MKKTVLMICAALFLCACGGGKYYVRGEKAAPAFEKTRTVVIVKNEATRESFLDAAVAWLQRHSYQAKIISAAEAQPSVPYLTYTARWSWDGGIFLADATVKAIVNGVPAAYSSLKVPNNLNFSKYGNADDRIGNLFSLLFFHQPESGSPAVIYEME